MVDSPESDETGDESETEVVHHADIIGPYIKQLDRTTSRLSRDGFVLVGLTLLNAAVVLFTAAYSLSGIRVVVFNSSTVSSFSLLSTLLATFLVIRFQREVAQGELIEEEISDELQWRLRQSLRKDPTYAEERTPLPLRISLRRFSAAIRLPFARRRGRAPIYALFNLLLAIIVIIYSVVGQL